MTSGSPVYPAMELTKDQFLQDLDSCLWAANRGQSHIVTHKGEQYAAVVSMAEYAQLQHLKTLLQQAGLKLLQGHSLQDCQSAESPQQPKHDLDRSNENSCQANPDCS